MIHEVRADHYHIPLPVPLSDSTHGTIRGFELVTAATPRGIVTGHAAD